MRKVFRKSFFKKIRFKYKVSVLNENTLEETFYIRLSRLNVFLVTCSLIAISLIINSALIIKTPIKQFLPGYQNSNVRAEIIHSTMLVDSLSHKIDKQEKYMEILRNIVSGNISVNEKNNSMDSIALQEREKILLTKSKGEEDFCEDFEQEEQYNLSILSVPKIQKAFVFFKPAKGIIAAKFNIKDSHYGINISTAPNENVVSVLDGTIIFAGFTIEERYIVVIQHDNEYTTVYKNNSQLLKSIGNNVKAGETIAIAGNTGKEKEEEKHLHFELWQKGKPLNPEEYIIF